MNLPGLNLTNLYSHVQKIVTFFPITNQCQLTKILTPNSLAKEPMIIY